MTLMWTLLRGMIEEASPCFEQQRIIPKAFFLLVQVEQHPHPADLAWRLLLPAPTVSQIVRQLETAGLLKREIDAVDRRRVRLALTEAGVRVRAEIQECLNRTLQPRIDQLSPDQLHELITTLQSMREHGLPARTRDGRQPPWSENRPNPA